ncbi:MAG: Flp pilus assembly protein CpaB [Solirubrobacteraceae bacterium]
MAAALLAGVLLYAFVQHYRKSPPPTVASPSGSVIIATGFIPAGTPAAQVAASDGLQHASVASGVALAGAISDSSQIAGEVAAKNIYPGQQIVSADFVAGDVTIGQYLSASERAIEIPIDATHGLQGYILPGDHIDLLTSNGAAHGTLATVATNIQVLSVGAGVNGAAESSGAGSLVLAVSDALAPKLAFASDSGSIWVLLRPPVWAKPANQATSGAAK